VSYYLDCVKFAQKRLSEPPRSEFSRRVERRGTLVAPFILDLKLSQPQNQHRRARAWKRHADRKRILDEMAKQWVLWGMFHMAVVGEFTHPALPISGRPQVNAVRFTTRMTDQYANFAKEAIDCLGPSRDLKWGHGLGIIAGDASHQIEENQWCELVRRSEPAFVYLEVRSGA
jgi:hypothetical protein